MLSAASGRCRHLREKRGLFIDRVHLQQLVQFQRYTHFAPAQVIHPHYIGPEKIAVHLEHIAHVMRITEPRQHAHIRRRSRVRLHRETHSRTRHIHNLPVFTYAGYVEIELANESKDAIGIAVYNDSAGTKYLSSAGYNHDGHSYIIRTDLTDPNAVEVAVKSKNG